MSKRLIGRSRAATLLTAMLLTTPAEANRFRDNPERVVDRARETWTSPIGELERDVVSKMKDGLPDVVSTVGSAFLVSPCYIMTAAHVVYGDELSPLIDKDYTLQFRAGTSATSAFAGKTTATPVISGNRDIAHRNDWALMKLNNCVGQRPELGWLEPSKKRLRLSSGKEVITLGFEALQERGALSAAQGRVLQAHLEDDLFKTDATFLPGQSGGPVLSIEDGTLVVSGMNVAELGLLQGKTYDHYTPDHANLIIDVTRILAKPYIKAILDDDKAAFGQPNPAAERLRMDHLPQ